MRITVAHARGDRPWNSQWPIRGAEYFRPLHKLIGVTSVRKIETGLQRGRWLSRKLRNTVLTQQRSTMSTCHSNFQFSQQSLIAFEPRFDFLAWIDTLKLMQRPKIFSRANRRRRFPRRVSSCNPAAWTQCFSIFSATTDRIRIVNSSNSENNFLLQLPHW